MKKIISLFIITFSLLVMTSCEEKECQHEWIETSRVASTCTVKGSVNYECSCGETKTEELPLVNHSYGTEYLSDETGHYHICSSCEVKDEVVAHTMVDDSVLIAPTAYEKGVMKTVCSVCNYEGERELDIIPHEKGTEYRSDNEYHWFECIAHENCTIVINKEEHNWEETSRVASTCTVNGNVNYTCVCGKTKTEELALASHSYGTEYYYSDEAGHYHKCINCNEEDKTIIAHTMIDNGVQKEPTNAEDGIMNTKCSICGYESTRVIPALSHVAGTYKYDDNNHWFVCGEHTDCGIIFNEEGHNWVETGRVASTCTVKGSITYTCVCGKTKIEEQELLEHDFNYDKYYSNETGHYHECNDCVACTEIESHSFTEWVVTKLPTLYQVGERTKYCVCGYAGTETEEIAAQADFADDFSEGNTETGVWQYGTVEYTWGESETFEFTALADKNSGNDGWVATDVEVKAGWINAGGMMGIAYTAGEAINVNTSIKFVGGTDLTRLSLRIGVKNSEETLYSNPTFYKMDSNTLELSLDFSLNAGDTIYFIFGNEASGVEGAYPNGALDITILPVTTYADFTDDFSVENASDAWKYGTIEYSWGDSETFEFTALTEKNEGSDGWAGTDVEVKAGWINAGSMMGIAYTAGEDIDVKTIIKFVGGTDLTRLSLRIGVKNSEGVLYSNPAFYKMESNTLELSLDYSLKAGDTIYFIFGNEAGDVEGAYPNGALDITLYK